MMRTFLVLILLTGTLTSQAQPTQFCMYPGDANNDGRANYLDLLPIGAAYNTPIEYQFIEDTFILWHLRCAIAFTAPPEVQGQSPENTLVYPGFSDSDGSGQVDSLDVFAIKWNYDSVQSASFPPPAPYLPPLLPTSECAGLRIKFVKDPFNDKKFYAHLFVATQTDQENVAMAVGLHMEYNPAYVVEDSTKVLFNPADIDLMGIGATHLNTGFQRQLPPGAVELAVSGRKQNTLNGVRQIASVQFIVTEDVILRNDTVDFTLDIDPNSIMLINKDELRICTQIFQDSIKLILTGQSLFAETPLSFRVYPNPAHEVLYLDFPEQAEVKAIRLYDAHGHFIKEWAPCRTIETGELSPGIYRIQLVAKQGTVWKYAALF